MNKMKEVAHLFGKELGEEFTIKMYGINGPGHIQAMFREDGLYIISANRVNNSFLDELLLGNMSIEE